MDKKKYTKIDGWWMDRKKRCMVGWIEKISEKKMDGWMKKNIKNGWMVDRQKKKMDGWMDKNI